MEPISALAFAGNVLQFVEFAFKIARAGQAFYRSEDGVEDGLKLEDVYEKLQALNGQLSLTINNGMSKDEKAVAELGDSCRVDCDHLLQIIQKLQSQGKKWKSFRFAVRYVWKDKQEIEELQSRLRDKQQTLNLYISSITKNTLQRLDGDFQRLSELNQKNEADHQARLDEICRSLDHIKDMLSSNHGASQPISASDVQDLSSQLSQVSLSERDVAKEQAILYSLDYERRTARYEAISEAHRKTFNWLFDDAERKALGAEKFLDWIKSSGEVFWISGKPGSGKSTFMKFVADHEQILKAASLWANPSEVIIASHYFWKAGDSMQKDQAGFLQGLLYDVLRQRPHITQIICGRQWSLSVPNAHLQRWTLNDLQQSFETLATHDSLRLKIVLFVDGLDEYEGDHIDLCIFLKYLAKKSSNIKICAASRPENAFEESFGSDLPHRINIHEITRNDILLYARSRLEEHPRWTHIIKKSQDLQSMCHDIADRARGVFLWVKLVTQSLRDGMTDYNTADELKNRLDSLPSDLESLYRHLLSSVDPQYHQKMAETLLLMSDMENYHYWEVFAMHEKSYKDAQYAQKITISDMKMGDKESIKEALQQEEEEEEKTILSRHIMSRCRGILEIHGKDIEWIHRTAHDFIKTHEMQMNLIGKCRPRFNAAIAELGARIACIIAAFGMMSNSSERDMLSLITNNRANLKAYLTGVTVRIWDPFGAPIVNLAHEKEAFKLLDHFFQTLQPYMDHVHGNTGNVPDKIIPVVTFRGWRFHTLTRPIDYGLLPEFVLKLSPRYSLHKLKMDPQYFQETIIPALQLPLQQWGQFGSPDWANLIHEMLRHGYELNRGSLIAHEVMARGFRPEIDLYRQEKHHVLSTPWISYIETTHLSTVYGPFRHIEKMLHSYQSQTKSVFNYRVGILLSVVKFERLLKEFIHDLSSGFVVTLLQHGADPNAQSTPFTTAWTSFVCAGITQPELLQVKDAYLKALDGFLQNGTDLGASTIGLTLDPGSTCTRLPWKLITGWEIFCEHLEHETLKHEDEKMIPFIAKIATRMIKYAVDTQWPLGRLPEILAKVFPDDLRIPMMQLTEQGSRQSKKRGAKYSPDMGHQRKQPRIEDVTEIEEI
ncbi:hypothetical protein G7054_g1068 [Neopestalotiopsis clavispora]|nr:hypothetical protein G7054_g1068 [Neopestalotiopsis clavispora]